MLNVKSTPIPPKHESTKELVERFSEHFESKIVNLRRELFDICPGGTVDSTVTCRSSLTHFQRVPMSSNKEHHHGIKTYKSCQLDPIPTGLLTPFYQLIFITVTYKVLPVTYKNFKESKIQPLG